MTLAILQYVYVIDLHLGVIDLHLGVIEEREIAADTS